MLPVTIALLRHGRLSGFGHGGLGPSERPRRRVRSGACASSSSTRCARCRRPRRRDGAGSAPWAAGAGGALRPLARGSPGSSSPRRRRRARRGPRRAARAAAAGSATARPRPVAHALGTPLGRRPRKSSPSAASQNTRMIPCWSMGRIGATATPTMTPRMPMKRVSSPTRMALSEMIAMREAERQRRRLPDELADERGRRAQGVARRGVRLVGGVDEVVGADVARDLGHRAADAEPDRADGGQDEGELRHARAGAPAWRGTGRPWRRRSPASPRP